MTVFTVNGESHVVGVGGGLTGLSLTAVELTREDDVPQLLDYLKACVLPRMPGADATALLRKAEDFQRKRLPRVRLNCEPLE